MSIRYRATSSGPDSQRQNHARRDRGLPPLAPGESRLLTQLVESAGSAGTAIVTGLALVAALASPITATGRADVSISSFLASTGTLGQVVGRGKAVDTVDSNSVTGSLSSVFAYGRGKITETGFSSTAALGTETGYGRGYVQQGGGYDSGFSPGYTSGLVSYPGIGVVTVTGAAYVLTSGVSSTGVLGTVTAIGGNGGSARAFVTGQFVPAVLAGTATGYSSGFNVGYGTSAFFAAADARGRAQVDIVGPVQFSFLNPVTGIGLGFLEFFPPFTAKLHVVPVLEGQPAVASVLDGDGFTSPIWEADASTESVLDGDLVSEPVLD